MSSKQLVRAGADTPDGHCANCGAPVFEMVPIGKLMKLAHSSQLAPSLDLCGMCFQIEGALIDQTKSIDHPERLAHYQRMMERFS